MKSRYIAAVRCSLICLASLICWLPVSVVFAGGGPENVVVVVNADSASSKMLANHYVSLRKIPANNVIYLSGIADREITGWKLCRRLILEPLAKEMEARKLIGSVDYIVYSSDFPTCVEIVDHRNKLFELIKKQTGREPQSRIYNANASLTSLTYNIGAVLQDQPSYLLLDSNKYYRNRAQVLLRMPFVGPQQKQFEETIAAIRSDDDAELEASIKSLIEFGKQNPKQLAIHYWLAKFYAKRGDAKTRRLG